MNLEKFFSSCIAGVEMQLQINPFSNFFFLSLFVHLFIFQSNSTPMKLWNSLRFSEISEQVKPQQHIHREHVQQDKLKRFEIKDQLDNQNIFL